MSRPKISNSSKMESFLLPTEDKDLLLQASRLFGVSKSRLIRLSCLLASRFILDSYEKANNDVQDEIIKFLNQGRKRGFLDICEKHRLKAEKRINCFLNCS